MLVLHLLHLGLRLDPEERVPVVVLGLLPGERSLVPDHGVEPHVHQGGRTLDAGGEVNQASNVASEAVEDGERGLQPNKQLGLEQLEALLSEDPDAGGGQVRQVGNKDIMNLRFTLLLLTEAKEVGDDGLACRNILGNPLQHRRP